MLTREELAQIRSQIESEYQKDVEALERLSRFLPESTSPVLRKSEPADFIHVATDSPESIDPNASLLGNGSKSILSGLEAILSEHHERTWTGPQLKAEIKNRGYELHAINPMATIGVALKKLVDRGKSMSFVEALDANLTFINGNASI